MDYLVVFHTYSAVLKLERELKHIDIAFESMPAPRHLSIACGISIAFSTTMHIDDIIKSISTNSIHKIFNVIDDEYKAVFIND